MKTPFFVILIIITALSLSCNNSSKKKPVSTGNDTLGSKKVVLYYFHGNRRCKTCIAIGNIAEKSVAENFKGNTDVAFCKINTDLEENALIAEKFQVSGSSLSILYNKDNKESIENITEFAFMYALSKPDTLSNTIVKKIKLHL